MRVVLQRVSRARVLSHGQPLGQIENGLLVLLGIGKDDTDSDVAWLAEKIAGLRIFADDAGLMNRSVRETAGGVLVVSQFTLHASTRKGNRPSFNDAARPEQALPLYHLFLAQMEAALGHPVARGEFGADMQVDLINDGPVTIVIDSKIRD